jgi:hypothetical protein
VLLRVMRPNAEGGEILYFTIPHSKSK